MSRPSIYTSLRGPVRSGRGVVLNVRGPIGSGKSTLLRGLEGRPPWRFWYLDVDQALHGHPPDLHGDFIRREGALELDILSLHARLILGRGLHLAMDQNFQTTAPTDRFLRALGRSRRDPRVVLIRLAVDREEAVRRKTTLRAAYVRASHRGFHLYPIAGEIVLETTGSTPGEVLRAVRGILRERMGDGSG